MTPAHLAALIASTTACNLNKPEGDCMPLQTPLRAMPKLATVCLRQEQQKRMKTPQCKTIRASTLRSFKRKQGKISFRIRHHSFTRLTLSQRTCRNLAASHLLAELKSFRHTCERNQPPCLPPSFTTQPFVDKGQVGEYAIKTSPHTCV
eukprot:514169-Pleurochrysis_carterae.AAC.2